ncbi:hypothetical protein [Streptomyces acidicola]|uniref:hypothetical protein n=1 Tax=Streptomyces acidicola TaxID=2596892 RepID=UPI00382A1427
MDRSLVSVRAALVLLLAILAGLAAGLLAVLAGQGWAGSVLYGLAATGSAVPVFNQVIAPDGVDVHRRLRGKGGDCG